MESLSAGAVDWIRQLSYGSLPPDVAEWTKLRVLDFIGLALAGSVTPAGRAMRTAAVSIGTGGPSHIIGYDDAVTPGAAALANGTFATALVFDSSHQEVIMHVATPVTAAAFGMAEASGASGAEFITAVAASTELLCRIGLIAPGEFHKRGLHPTGMLGAVASAYGAAYLLRLDRSQMIAAIGIVGSMSSGISEAFADGTWSHLMNAGWGAQCGIAAALIAKTGFSGPIKSLEGRFGLIPSHLHDLRPKLNFPRMLQDIGEVWESRKITTKFYSNAHFIHPYLDALLELMRENNIKATDIARVVCPIAAYQIPVICTPVEEKRRPVSDFQARTSLQYSIAEAAFLGKLGAAGYAEESLRDPKILALTDRVEYVVDETAPGSAHYKGWVKLELSDGRKFERVVVHTDKPDLGEAMQARVRAKFEECAETAGWAQAAPKILAEVMTLGKASSLASLMRACTRSA